MKQFNSESLKMPNVNKLNVYRFREFAKEEKAKEFTAAGGEIYHGNTPEGAKHDH